MKGSTRASRIFAGLPPYAAGLRIGLYGGSFNPAHDGHRLVSLLALRRLGLDSVWWLVTPGNPLKDTSGLAPLGKRMERAARVAAHPRIAISAAEQAFRTRYTADLIQVLRRRAGATRFVWIMGSDNLAEFHRWERWREIAAAVPIAVVNRPSFLAAALAGPAAQALWRDRVDDADSGRLALSEPPAWTFLVGPRTTVSSTSLRGGAPAS